MPLRPYRDSDLTAVVELFTASVHGLAAPGYDAAQREAWAPRPPDPEAWRTRLAGLRAVVAEDDGGPAGFVAYSEGGHVDLLYVAPGQARRGVASRLLAHAEAALAATGVRELTTEASLVARPFFEARGYHVVDEQTVERGGVALPRLAMRKTLPARDRAPSILERALGARFSALHPLIQRQYRVTSADGIACHGRGVVEVWRGPALVGPFLWLGAKRQVLFPETGADVPFTLASYCYVDGFGRETLTWNRTFSFDRPRRFDETLVWSERRRRPVVYAGTHQHLAVELAVRAGDDGALRVRTRAQRLYEWRLPIRIPQLVSAFAEVREWVDDERTSRFGIEVALRSPVLGPVFGYRGWFDLEWRPCPREEIPAAARPVREERRE